MKLLTHTAQNNITVGTVHKPQGEFCLFYISAPIHQVPGHKALSEVYQDVLLAGAGPYNRQQLLEKIVSLGSDIAISELNGILTIAVKCMSAKLKPTLTLLEHMILSPHFAPKEVVRAKKSALNSLQVHSENARAQALLGLKHTLFTDDNRRYEPTTNMLERDIVHVSSRNLSSLHQALLQQPWTVSIGGTPRDCAIVEQKISRLKQIKQNEDDASVKSLTARTPDNLYAHPIPSKHNIEFSIGKLVPLNLSGDAYPSLHFGISVLGLSGGFSGRLMSTVREKEGLTYGIYAYLESATKDESGYMRIMTFFSPGDAVRGLSSTFREITSLYNNGITETELNHFKTILNTRHQLIFDSLQNTTQHLHQLLLKGLDIDSDHLYMEKLLSVTRTSVHEAVFEYLNPATFTLSMAGPTKAIKQDIEQFCSNTLKTTK